MTEHPVDSSDSFDQYPPKIEDETASAEAPAEEHDIPRSSRSRKRSGPAKRKPVPQAQGGDSEASELCQLEAQGFTHDEAARLLHISDRLANSREAREAEAVLRRLRFQRWLLERGLLDEFSA